MQSCTRQIDVGTGTCTTSRESSLMSLQQRRQYRSSKPVVSMCIRRVIPDTADKEERGDMSFSSARVFWYL
jgi:hypothetical protein